MITIFVSYSHSDETFRNQLDKHFAPLKHQGDVEFWHDGKINPGAGLDPEIRRALRRSGIFLALVSSDYLASDYCFRREYQYALNRARRKTMRVIVALVRTCPWKQTRIAYYKCLPNDGKPVDQWGNRNKAYVDIVEGVSRVVAEVRKELKAARASDSVVTEMPKSKRATRHASPSSATRVYRGKAASKTPSKIAARKKSISTVGRRMSVRPSRRRSPSASEK